MYPGRLLCHVAISVLLKVGLHSAHLQHQTSSCWPVTDRWPAFAELAAGEPRPLVAVRPIAAGRERPGSARPGQNDECKSYRDSPFNRVCLTTKRGQ